MARNPKLISVAPDQIIDGISVIHAATLRRTLFPKESPLTYDFKELSQHMRAWIVRNGAHYYAEEKWLFDEDDRMYAGFSVRKGVNEAKRFGARIVVVENLS